MENSRLDGHVNDRKHKNYSQESIFIIKHTRRGMKPTTQEKNE
jgi:hypothetical protein